MSRPAHGLRATIRRVGRGRWGIVGATLAALVGAVVAFVTLAAWRPAFYAPATAAEASEPKREQAARRLVTRVSALHASMGRVGRWEGVIADEELNAWLDIDLPKNHPTLLPARVRRPHVVFGEKRIRAGVTVGYGLASVVFWADAEVVLRDVNQLAITMHDARLGLVPVPGSLVLETIAARLAPLGAVSEIRRIEGNPVLVVYIPTIHGGGATLRLEGLRIDAGEVLVEGVTRPPIAR